MTCMPTTREGFEGAIGHFINDANTAKMVAAEKDWAERTSQPGYEPGPFVWAQKSDPKPRFDMAVYCARIRAGGGSRDGMRAC